MRELLPHAERVAQLLIARKETVAVIESSSGGLVTAALLALPGASRYVVGGAVTYSRPALLAIQNPPDGLPAGMRAASEAYALFVARIIRERTGATWGLAETGAAGPTGNRYGDPAGHSCFAVAGTREAAKTLRTGESARVENMYAFAKGALQHFAAVLDAR